MGENLGRLEATAKRLHGDGWQPRFWSAVRSLAKAGDLMAYGMYVHGDEVRTYRDFAYSAHGRILADAFEKDRKVLAVTHPEAFKSTLTRWYVEKWLGSETERHFENPLHPAPCSIYAMGTAIQAVRMAKTIASTIEGNPRFKELYPNCVPDTKWGWSSEQFYLARRVQRPDPSLFPVGITGPIQGMRAGLGVVDDPTSQKDARSPTTLRDQIDWRLGMFKTRLVEDAKEIDIMTRWADNDTYATLEKDETRRVIVMPAIGYWTKLLDDMEKGETPREAKIVDLAEVRRLADGVRDVPPIITEGPDALFPAAWPLTRLAKEKRTLLLRGDGGLWTLVYLCDPKRAEGRLFKRRWFSYGLPMEGAPAPQAEALCVA